MSGLAPSEYIVLKAGPFDKGGRLGQVEADATLEYRCRVVVAAHLEQYPPDALGILSEQAWDSVITLRHERTSPKKGKRLHAAVTERFLTLVEQENDHLAESNKSDKLVWKDIVELRFPLGGLSRPTGLEYPWPVLVERIVKAGTYLTDVLSFLANNDGELDTKHENLLRRTVSILKVSPVNVDLLQETKIGKTVKKFVTKSKKFAAIESPSNDLSVLLSQWKEMAGFADPVRKKKQSDDREIAADLKEAQTCQTWRDVFHILQGRHEKRQVSQGLKMRERRDRLKKTQPKIVKVRPAKTQHDRILHRPVGQKYAAAAGSSPAMNKMQALRQESKVAATWQKSNPNVPTKPSAGFGNAVAFASIGKMGKKRAASTVRTVSLKGNKRMKAPTKIPASTLKKKLSKPFRR